MYSTFFTLFTLFATTHGFQNSVTKISKPVTTSFEFYGDIEPTGFFDPLQVTQTCDEKTLQYMLKKCLIFKKNMLY